MLLIYMAIGLFIWERNGVVIAAVYFLVCLPLYFIYAAMERNQYKKHITAFVDEHYENRGQQKTSLDFEEKQILMKDGTKESIVPITDLDVIYETGSLYSLSLKSGQAILIPKNNTTTSTEITGMLQKLADRHGIPYQAELKWKWH